MQQTSSIYTNKSFRWISKLVNTTYYTSAGSTVYCSRWPGEIAEFRSVVCGVCVCATIAWRGGMFFFLFFNLKCVCVIVNWTAKRRSFQLATAEYWIFVKFGIYFCSILHFAICTDDMLVACAATQPCSNLASDLLLLPSLSLSDNSPQTPTGFTSPFFRWVVGVRWRVCVRTQFAFFRFHAFRLWKNAEWRKLHSHCDVDREERHMDMEIKRTGIIMIKKNWNSARLKQHTAYANSTIVYRVFARTLFTHQSWMRSADYCHLGTTFDNTITGIISESAVVFFSCSSLILSTLMPLSLWQILGTAAAAASQFQFFFFRRFDGNENREKSLHFYAGRA